MLTLSFNGSDQRVAEFLRLRGEKVISAIERQMNVSMLKLQSYVQSSKLSGSPLQHRTGKLIGSIRTEGAHLDGTQVVGSVQGAGGPAWYGRVHEYGGVFTSRGRGKSPKPYEMHFPERSFMRSSLADLRAQIFEDLKTAAIRAVKT